MKKLLKDVTLLSYNTNPDRMDGTILALQKCCENFGFYQVKLICDKKPDNLPKNIIWEYAPHINNINDFNQYMFSELDKHVESSHMLFVHDHAYILSANTWDDNWLKWDFCGAPWRYMPDAYICHDTGEHVRVGNGGFSLRSKFLLGIPKKYNIPLTHENFYYNEDGNVAVYNRVKFLKLGVKYMPLEESCKFSYENPVPENNYGNMKTFGFHRNFPPSQMIHG